MASQLVTLKALGLNYSPNLLGLEQGSLVQADDIIIRRDNVVESRRGFREYSEQFGSGSDRAKQLLEYKEKVLVHYSNKILFDTSTLDSNGKAIFNAFSGTYSETQDGLRIKSIEANKNLYFTTSEGIKKISARTSDDFTTASGFIKNAGAIKALDITGRLVSEQGNLSGFLPNDSAVAYRAVWGYKDLNDNLILGTPSNRVEVYNYALDTMAMDLNTLDIAIDNLNQSPSLITDGNYATSFYTPLNSDATTLLANVQQLAIKLDQNILLAGTGAPLTISNIDYDTGGTVTIKFTGVNDPTSYMSVGDHIEVKDVTATNFDVVNGNGTLTAVVAPVGAVVGYIQYIIGKQTTAYSTTTPGSTSKIYSYNYRNISTTGDSVYSQAIDSFDPAVPPLTLSIPATAEQIGAIYEALYRISERLKVELTGVIPSTLKTTYITPFVITSSANVELDITIPTNINPDYFVQVYRTRIFTATAGQTLGGSGGIPVIPDDEMRLVYEAFPTTAEIAAGYMIFLDTSPEALVQNNTNLYTNPETGEGLIAANEPPPFAKDINRFKNVVFYANTRTKQRLNSFQLLGISNIVADDTITIASADGSDTYTFVAGANEVTDITCLDAGSITDGMYFTMHSANDATYYAPYYVKDGATITPPTVPNFPPVPTGQVAQLVRIDILSGDNANKVTQKTINTLNTLIYDFDCTFYYKFTVTSANTKIGTSYINNGQLFTVLKTINSGTTLYCSGTGSPLASGTLTLTGAGIGDSTITFSTYTNPTDAFLISNTSEGITTDASTGTSTFTVTTITQGNGENAAAKQILLSSLTSAAQAIAETAQSFIRVINKQSTSVVNGYYISGENSPPGQINLQEITLSPVPFYILGSTSGVGLSFNPDIGPIHTNITNISKANPAVITAVGHGLLNGDQIVITNSNSSVSVDGLWTITKITDDTFSVPVDTSGGASIGTRGSWSKVADVTVSTNDIKPNRIYYSKLGQPEAVPLLNYFDISAEDKEILRIFPLRDTLFAFKQDGTYRISGEIAPFQVSLLDSSCILVAPDSVAATNNIVHMWTSKGITPISETGASYEVSRPIDTEILRLSSSSFINFSKVTWGVGYDSDSSYTIYTNAETTDTAATIAFRYCTLTNTWTNFIRTQTCGLNLISQDVLYMGSGDSNLIHKERKDFTRNDYADKDFVVNLANGNLNSANRTMTFTSVDGINEGDAITQEQTLTIYEFNSLLRKLDLDPTVGLSTLSSTSGSGTVITVQTTASHYLSNSDYVTLSSTDSYPSLNGTYKISNVTSDTFTISIATPLLTQSTIGKVKRSYEDTLNAVDGDNMRDKIVTLATYLDTDPGTSLSSYSNHIATKNGAISTNDIGNPTVVTSVAHGLVDGRIVTISGTPNTSIPAISGKYSVSNITTDTFTIPINVLTTGSGGALTFDTSSNLNTFEDIKACYNEIITMLNSDSGVTYNTYQLISNTTLFEAVVLSVNKTLNRITVNLPLQWVVGPMTVYNAINCQIEYGPMTMGDPLMSKQMSEVTIMFTNKAVTKFTASFSSDLKPEFTDVVMYGQGNGIFGHYSDPGFGHGFFGGASNNVPFRTLIPAQNQRCRFLNTRITYRIAHESWSLLGVTFTGTIGISSRAYR